MHSFKLPDMSCGHCVAAITQAVQGVDAQARLQFDLPNHQVQIDSDVTREALAAALIAAGYTPAPADTPI